ncbi:MAG: phosphate starvation-inducible protein PhoH [Candidatus Fraserbacteria bacterium RBG_16_55_9]|uniref:PhoH-like protein n=1 Tax=Fraserbacteria sp. (strain RBG_16_55_9) TaxID=1817864 RepID=A0A1F5UXE3_FRAXR|nr:MAG: phosphate starvation-inducible protein PhoH [Candidatus Fraserbacteria bacterium RBG_16_55_9]
MRAQREIALKNVTEATALLGSFNRNLNIIHEWFPVQVRIRGDRLLIEGDEREVAQVAQLLDKLRELIDHGHIPELSDVEYLAEQIRAEQDVGSVLVDVVQHTHWGEPIRPKTKGQSRYVQAIEKHEIVFAIGPSGTGKTYLAVAMAVNSLKKSKVSRLILTRPAVEAGEELGFLPGDIQAKVNPYLRPLYDALYDILPGDEVKRYLESGRIEIAPLAFMRGRTLNNSFIILDEAQNTTSGQMKMFLTRLGLHSRAVITGDVTQIDLQRGVSGLVAVQRILEGIDEISFIYLEKSDVVRHPLVKRIIDAYEKMEQPKE